MQRAATMLLEEWRSELAGLRVPLSLRNQSCCREQHVVAVHAGIYTRLATQCTPMRDLCYLQLGGAGQRGAGTSSLVTGPASEFMLAASAEKAECH